MKRTRANVRQKEEIRVPMEQAKSKDERRKTRDERTTREAHHRIGVYFRTLNLVPKKCLPRSEIVIDQCDCLRSALHEVQVKSKKLKAKSKTHGLRRGGVAKVRG